MQGYGGVRMKGKLTKPLGCLCCTAINKVKITNYKKTNWKLLDDQNDSTQDHVWIVNWFKKNRGVDIEIQAQHPFELDVIFDVKTGKWLGYVSEFCFIHDDMNCEVCLDGEFYE